MIIKRNVPLHTCSIYSSFAQILDRLGLAIFVLREMSDAADRRRATPSEENED